MQVSGTVEAFQVMPHRRTVARRKPGGGDGAHGAVVTKSFLRHRRAGPLLEEREKWRTPSYDESKLGEVAHPPQS